MKASRYWILFILGLIIALGVVALQDAPGYMDADYYFYGGLRLANGDGFSEMVLWNFLDDPQGLPHPSHTYWMPLPSIVAAFGILFFRFLNDFDAAQFGFILISAAIPPLTAALSMKFSADSKKAFYAGILALFSGFFLPMMTTTESFGLFMLLGGVFFLIICSQFPRRLFVLGILAGLMHLTRADGLLWLLTIGVVILFELGEGHPDRMSWLKSIFTMEQFGKIGEALFGYLIIMGAWYVRNISLYDSVFPPGSGATLWMLNYDEIFSFPASMLTFDRWWASGLGSILSDRFQAFGLNLQSGFVVQGLVVLGPLALSGAIANRKKTVIKVGWFSWSLLLVMMTIVFPYAGMRGGFFHSSAAFMPLIWALVPIGIINLSHWTVVKFNWEVRKISPFFHGVVVLVVVLISLSQVSSKLIGVDTNASPWSSEARVYQTLENRLLELGASPEDIVLVSNPPGYTHVSGRPAIVIPNGDEKTLLAVIETYQPQYLLLSENHPRELRELYQNPMSAGKLTYVETIAATHIFIVEEDSP